MALDPSLMVVGSWNIKLPDLGPANLSAKREESSQLLSRNIQLDIGVRDRPCWIWNPKMIFFSQEHLLSIEILRCLFILGPFSGWWSRDRSFLGIKGWQGPSNCIMCSGDEKFINHLFLEMSFLIWEYVAQSLNLSIP